jgi:hypothetical protein
MTTLMFEHIKASELPAKWAQQLNAKVDDTVTVRIEIEQPGPAEEKTAEDLSAEDPLFGIWRDHEESADVAGYVRLLRESRY